MRPDSFAAKVAPNGDLFGTTRYGGVLRSTDGGSTWIDVLPSGDERFDFDWIDETLGFARSRFQIARTRDGGASWEVVTND